MTLFEKDVYKRQSPVCIACEVVRIEELGSHDMFIANVKGVYADEAYICLLYTSRCV